MSSLAKASRTLTALLLIGSVTAAASAQSTTYSQEEMDRFLELRRWHLEVEGDVEEARAVAAALEDLLRRYPSTVNKKSALLMLFEARSLAGTSCDTLTTVADRVLEMGPLHQDYYTIAEAYDRNGCGATQAQSMVERAIASMAGATPVRPSSYHHLLGRLQHERGLHREAVASYEQAFALMDSAIVKEEQASAYTKIAGVRDLRGRQRLLIGQDLARAYVAVGDEDEGLALYEALYLSYPKDDSLAQAFERALYAVGHSQTEVQHRLNRLWADVLLELEEAVASGKLNEEPEPFALQTTSGREVRLSDFRGKVTVVSFWAGWCAPCYEEIPYLIELAQAYEDAPFGVVLVNLDDAFAVTLNVPPSENRISSEQADVVSGVGAGEQVFLTREKMIDQVAEHFDLPFPVLVGDEQVKEDYAVSVLPLTLVFDQHGTLRYRHEGFDEKSLIRERLRMEIEHLLAE